VFARADDTSADPIGAAIERVTAILNDIARLTREADRKRQVILNAAAKYRGRGPCVQAPGMVGAWGRGDTVCAARRLHRTASQTPPHCAAS
jgi:hypothetical protein